LDSVDGKTLDAIRDLADVFDSEYSGNLLLERRKRDYVLRKEKDFQVPRLTFAILDAAFGPQSVAISESGGPVRCIDAATGKEMWRHTPARHVHFLSLWYREIDRDFYGVQRDFQKGSFRFLVRLQQRRT
jgi:hypothetical protein